MGYGPARRSGDPTSGRETGARSGDSAGDPTDGSARRALFDRVVVVDWSAASTPRRGRDSIWTATWVDGDLTLDNVPTRRATEAWLHGLLADDGGRRTLLGVDFSLGYPAGTAAAIGMDSGPPWRAMWAYLESAVVDDDRNRNNRFEVAAGLNRRLGPGDGPFWGRPATQPIDRLPATKPRPAERVGGADPEAVPEWRRTEAELRAQGRRPFSSWQLMGAGCVGSQSLLGIPVLERLRRRGGARVHVWPFTTGLEPPVPAAGDVVVAEVWPTLFESPLDRHPVRDAAQVAATAMALADLGRTGRLADLFRPAVAHAHRRRIVDEEGWVLGVLPSPTGPSGGAVGAAPVAVSASGSPSEGRTPRLDEPVAVGG